MKDIIQKAKLSLLTILCNATGIYRKGTVPADKKIIYKQNLKSIIIDLIKKLDTNSITNVEIRNSIKKLSETSNVSIGAAQKAVNVYLKFYCTISNKDENLLKELDCPVDSKIQNKNHLKKISLKSMTFEDYLNTQNILEEKYKIRIAADTEAYDDSKIY